MERRSRLEECRLLWQLYWNMAVESRSRLEDSRLLWQFYWNMAEEEASSGGHLRRDAQVGRGEEEQARGGQAALAVLLEHGRGEQGRIEDSRPLWQFH